MKKIFVIASVLLTFANVNAQTFGFGCLGLSGIFGGYGYQFYDAKGLNSYISEKVATGELPEISNQDFTQAQGAYVGINIFRAKFSSSFLTVKGFYQFAEERKEFPGDGSTDIYEMNFNYFGVGLDFGIPLGSFVYFKLFDAGATYSDVILKVNSSDSNGEYYLEEYKPEKPVVGYFVGSGLIFNFVKNYISLEITARYHFTQYSDFIDNSGNYFLNDNTKLLIDKAGIQATAQLNLGIPL